MLTMWRTRGLWMFGCALACAGACSAGNGAAPPPTGRLSAVYLNVHAWNEALVAAVITDRYGRRTGWTKDGSIDEIKGCTRESGWEDGIPNPRPDDADTAGVAAWERSQADTIMPGEPEPLPKYHFFHILNDAITTVGLIDQGGCELRLDPIVAGKVQLALSANRNGATLCQDTTSVWVRPGVPLRWRLSWKANGDGCKAKMTRIGVNGAKGQLNK